MPRMKLLPEPKVSDSEPKHSCWVLFWCIYLQIPSSAGNYAVIGVAHSSIDKQVGWLFAKLTPNAQCIENLELPIEVVGNALRIPLFFSFQMLISISLLFSNMDHIWRLFACLFGDRSLPCKPALSINPLASVSWMWGWHNLAYFNHQRFKIIRFSEMLFMFGDKFYTQQVWGFYFHLNILSLRL